jgi:hypothetical protein
LADKPFQKWFHANLKVKAAELILQERPIQTRPERELAKPSPLNRRASSTITLQNRKRNNLR